MKNHLRENKPFCEQNTEAPSALRGSVNPRKPGQKASLTEDHPCNTEILKSCILSYGWSRSELPSHSWHQAKPAKGGGRSIKETPLWDIFFWQSTAWPRHPAGPRNPSLVSSVYGGPRPRIFPGTSGRQNKFPSQEQMFILGFKEYQQIFFQGQWTICSKIIIIITKHIWKHCTIIFFFLRES